MGVSSSWQDWVLTEICEEATSLLMNSSSSCLTWTRILPKRVKQMYDGIWCDKWAGAFVCGEERPRRQNQWAPQHVNNIRYIFYGH